MWSPADLRRGEPKNVQRNLYPRPVACMLPPEALVGELVLEHLLRRELPAREEPRRDASPRPVMETQQRRRQGKLDQTKENMMPINSLASQPEGRWLQKA